MGEAVELSAAQARAVALAPGAAAPTRSQPLTCLARQLLTRHTGRQSSWSSELGGSPMKHFTRNARRITTGAAVAGALMLAPAIAMASAESPARPAAAAVAPGCQTPGLVIWLDTSGNGAAGTTFFKLHFTNLSGHACTLNGFPFLFAVNLAGHQVGRRAAFRKPAPHLVTLANGKTATAVLGIVDTGVFSRSACRPVTAAGLRVFPPNQTRSKLIPFPFSTCSRPHGAVSLNVGAVTR